jgi:hypothetical protein
MPGDRSVSSVSSTATHVVPLPYALYESNGLLFELYEGGQQPNPQKIRWIRLKPRLMDSPNPTSGPDKRVKPLP